MSPYSSSYSLVCRASLAAPVSHYHEILFLLLQPQALLTCLCSAPSQETLWSTTAFANTFSYIGSWQGPGQHWGGSAPHTDTGDLTCWCHFKANRRLLNNIFYFCFSFPGSTFSMPMLWCYGLPPLDTITCSRHLCTSKIRNFSPLHSNPCCILSSIDVL